jgi:hypothetical protein
MKKIVPVSMAAAVMFGMAFAQTPTTNPGPPQSPNKTTPKNTGKPKTNGSAKAKQKTNTEAGNVDKTQGPNENATGSRLAPNSGDAKKPKKPNNNPNAPNKQ